MSDMIQLGISADSSDLGSSLATSRAELKTTESAFSQFGNTVASSMKFAGDISVAAIQEIGGALRSVTQGALGGFGHAMGTAAGTVAVTGAAVGAASSYFGGLWTTIRAGLSVASWFNPWLKTITIGLGAATAATYAYRTADAAMAGGLTQSIASISRSSKAWGEFKAASEQVSSSLRNVGGELLSLGGFAVKSTADITGVSAAFRAVDSAVASTISFFAKGNSEWASGIQILTDKTWDLVAAGNVSAETFRKQGEATEALIAKQQSQVGQFEQLKSMYLDAGAQAQHGAELQRIASIGSVDAINAEILALQQKTAATILAGNATEESQKKAAAYFAALENQRVKIESGGMEKEAKTSPVDAALKSAREALNAQRYGADQSQILNLRQDGASETDLTALENIQKETAAQKALNAAKEEQKKLDESAVAQTDRLHDQIDLLTGAATKGGIAMREAFRAGMTEEAAEEIGKLTDDLAKLQDAEHDAKKSPKAEKADKTLLKVAFAGSQEAASIALRGVGRPDGDKGTEKLVNVSQQILIATKANKPQMLMPLNL